MERMSDQALLSERLRGRTLRDLADTTVLSIEGVRVVVAREGGKQIDEIELALLANTKTDDLLAFVVPEHGGPDFDSAMSYVQWVCRDEAKPLAALRMCPPSTPPTGHLHHLHPSA
jgi:hypothetical protein